MGLKALQMSTSRYYKKSVSNLLYQREYTTKGVTTPNYQIHAPSKTQTDGTHPGQDTHVRPKAPASADSRNEGKTEATATQSEPPTNGPTTAQDKSPPQAGSPLPSPKDAALTPIIKIVPETTTTTSLYPTIHFFLQLCDCGSGARNTSIFKREYSYNYSYNYNNVTTCCYQSNYECNTQTYIICKRSYQRKEILKEFQFQHNQVEILIIFYFYIHIFVLHKKNENILYKNLDSNFNVYLFTKDTIDNNQQTKLSGAPSPKTKDLIIQPEVQPANSISTHSAYTPSGDADIQSVKIQETVSQTDTKHNISAVQIGTNKDHDPSTHLVNVDPVKISLVNPGKDPKNNPVTPKALHEWEDHNLLAQTVENDVYIKLLKINRYKQEMKKRKKENKKTLIEVHMEVFEEYKNDEWELHKGDFLEICLRGFINEDNDNYQNFPNSKLTINNINEKTIEDIQKQEILWNNWIEDHRNILEQWKKEEWFHILKNKWIKEQQKYKENNNKLQENILNEEEKHSIVILKEIWKQWIEKQATLIDMFNKEDWFKSMVYVQDKEKDNYHINEYNNISLTSKTELKNEKMNHEHGISKNIIQKLMVQIHMMVLEECIKDDIIKHKELCIDNFIEDIHNQNNYDEKRNMPKCYTHDFSVPEYEEIHISTNK
ncbi:STP1 protein [Plasmodium ovale wallikeri]|uniref:STP1 protein n=1 Tax=Plasmodium ovale wallikeri TaxID=864142 RepID=A0A1A9ALB3_PLAOA|nr:STP1 protein [Plasmodium ovale wallikeri]